MSEEKIFVFGSNLAGRHGAGAAKFAREQRGAVYGQGTGRQGQSYAIPTKKADLQPLQLWKIAVHVQAFLEYARANPALRFEVTRIGCGLAGFREESIKPLFREAPANCDLPEGWR